MEKHSWTLGYSPDKSIQYHEPEEGDPLKLDLFLPSDHKSSDKRACVIFFLGGGWSGGATDQFYGYGKYMASRGLVAISVQYRTRKSHQAIPRQCVEDGKAAIRYVREHAIELVSIPIGSQRAAARQVAMLPLRALCVPTSMPVLIREFPACQMP